MENYKVYCHISPSNKKYYGITSERLVTTRWKAGNGYIKQKKFYNAIKKYGWNNFKHEIIADNLTFEEACKMEQKLIKKDKTYSNEGYNISIGGECGSKMDYDSKREKYISTHEMIPLFCFINETKLIVAENQVKLAEYLNLNYDAIDIRNKIKFKRNIKDSYYIQKYSDPLYALFTQKYKNINNIVILWEDFKPKEYEILEKEVYGLKYFAYREKMSC